MENVNIDEMIADAKAEEEVEKEQAKATKEEEKKKEFKDFIKDVFTPINDSKVTISLREYTLLLQKEIDLQRILDAIVDGLELGYNKEYLILNKRENVVDAIRVLYPDTYDHLLSQAKTESAEKVGE